MEVRIPTPLRSYTAGEAVVDAAGVTVNDILSDLDRRFPGIRFRMIDERGRVREHMKIFIDDERVRDLGSEVAPNEVVTIMQALSGG